MDPPLIRPLVRRVHGWAARRNGTRRDLVRRRPERARRERPERPSLWRGRRRARRAPADPVRQRAARAIAVLVPVVAAGRPVGGSADTFEIKDRRFASYILANPPVEELATGFRWLEGPGWFGGANCPLFQGLPLTSP